MSFTRTQSGLKNSSLFFGADITVIVEGKKRENAISSDMSTYTIQTADELFHNAVFSALVPKKVFKIKSVGCKGDLDEYSRKIHEGAIDNCVVVYDSDYEPVLASWVATPLAMRTSGYSWENDLWNWSVCERVVNVLSGGRDWNREHLSKQINRAARRLARASRIEVLCRTYGLNLIVPNGKSVGLRLSAKSAFGVDSSELCRVIGKVKPPLRLAADKEFNGFVKNRVSCLDCVNLVRGHLWEALCITLIVAVLKGIGACNTLPTETVRNAALGVFTQATIECLTLEAQNHYKAQLRRAFPSVILTV